MKVTTLLQLCHLAYEQIQADKDNVAKWQPLFDDSCNQLLRLEPRCPAVLLMRGILNLQYKKIGYVTSLIH